MPNGKLIVFEGLDGCFKQTQTTMLHHKLRTMYPDKKIELIDFPQYSSPSGQTIHKYLYGEFGYIPPQLASDMYSMDRACAWYGFMKRKYKEGTIFIVDRYTYSNCIYQGARSYMETLVEDKYRDVALQIFIIGVMNREFNVYGIPRPDVVIHLDMPYENMIDILNDRKNKDNHEKDNIFLQECLHIEKIFYGDIMKNDPTIHHIKCVDKNGLRTREAINESVMGIVLPLLEQE